MDKNSISKFLTFVAGVAVGSLVTWRFVEKKYKQITEEEIESVREVYKKVYGNQNGDDEKIDEDSLDDEYDEDADDKKEYDSIISKNKYTDGDNEAANKKKKEDEEDCEMLEPYIIDYDDFDDIGYTAESLYYYDDGVLINSITNEQLDVEATVGQNNIDTLLESGEDYTYVRNEAQKIDYEILRDRRNFSEVN